MRKVGSAPSLTSLGSQSHQEKQDRSLFPPRLPKSGSAGSINKQASGSCGLQGDVRCRPSVGGRLRDLRQNSFPLAAMDASIAQPQESLMTEEFAESARGLAGLECFELYGPQAQGPPLRSEDAGSGPQDGQPQLDKKAAFASCLETPVTGEDKNLGELVDAEARALLQTAEEVVQTRYEQELSTESNASSFTDLAPVDQTNMRRKRRLAEKFGFGPASNGREKRSASDIFPDCPEAQQMLTNLTSLDDDSNKCDLGEEVCFGDMCFPTEEACESVFNWQHPSQLPLYKACPPEQAPQSI